jgi:hypothetical protein
MDTDRLEPRPTVKVSRSGVFYVDPIEIFLSEVDREAILKTAALRAARSPSPRLDPLPEKPS